MNLSDINWPVILIALSGALILLLRDWRIAVPALLLNYTGVAVFRAQRQRAAEPLRLSDYVVPFWALALAVLASVALPRIYPIGTTNTIDFVWYCRSGR